MTRTIKALLLALAIMSPVAALASCGGDDSSGTTSDAACLTDDAHDAVAECNVPDAPRDVQPDRPYIHTDAGDAGPSFNLWPAASGPIKYWGGPVVLGTANVYFVWYGDWKGSNTPSILEDLVKGFSQTGYSNILTDYYQVPRLPVDGGAEASVDLDAGADADASDAMMIPDGPKEYVSGRVAFARSIYVGYTRGPDLREGDVRGIVTDLLRAGDLPYDPTAIYFVMTSSDVTEGDGWSTFCGDYCGWHNGHVIDGVPIQYALVGDPKNCLDGCSLMTQFQDAGISTSPNDNWSADGMASVVIHELSEAITDPQPYDNPAWLDESQNAENGDMCAWRFDPTYPTLNGSRANVRFGGRDFLIQQMWVIDGDGGRCDLQR